MLNGSSIGLGTYPLERLRNASARAARAVRDRGLKRYGISVFFAGRKQFDPISAATAIVEGAVLGLYTFTVCKSPQEQKERKEITTVTILSPSVPETVQVRKAALKAEIIAEGVFVARDLVSRPANSATPAFLARCARSMAKKHGMRCTVISTAKARSMGMGAFMGVAQGSDEPGCFIVMDYRPAGRKQYQTVVLAGKAITFDSGGISLKPSKDMDEMKTDMAGGAAVLGCMQVCARLRLPLRVVGIIPATENLPSGHALKPGDILRSLSGKTIEILSTDAEGRLVLADALTYARRFKPAAIIDLATLTGACVIALGNEASGLMGTDERLLESITRAGERTGERVWPLPLWEEYGELIKSDIADIKNLGGRSAGCITAGYFLKTFAEDIPWAHLDIAGTAWSKKDRHYIPKGATGIGVRLLTEVLENWPPT